MSLVRSAPLLGNQAKRPCTLMLTVLRLKNIGSRNTVLPLRKKEKVLPLPRKKEKVLPLRKKENEI
jgi:hypothetical protein